MSDKLRGVLEDSRTGLLLKDFSGGLITDVGGLSLQANQTPDSQNVFAWEGNLLFAGGYGEFCPLDGPADGAYVYYDLSRVRHMVVWRNGNIYDTVSGAEVVIASAVYTPGERIARAQLNGILYWSTLTAPLRQWNGVTEMLVPNSGTTGTVAPPACSFLIAFNGALVAVSVVVAGVPNLGAFMWCQVNDPTTWLGVNTQVVGSNDGSIAQFAVSLGVAQVGVTPTKQFLVGKSSGNMFLYTGALGSLVEQQVSCPTGCLSGDSAVYIPTTDGFGAVMFLGSDGQFYLCNGVQAPVASKGIKTLVVALVNAALATNPSHRFSAVYNSRWQYYLIDMGNNYQLAYKWDANPDGGAWWLFKGWPPGYYMSAPGTTGVFSVYVASSDPDNLGVFELALDNEDFNGTPLSDVGVYWTSAYIHGGKPERLKLFQDLTLFFYNSGVRYKCTVYGMPNSNAVTPTSRPLSFNTPAVGAITQSGGPVWNQAYWNQAYWGGPGFVSFSQPLQIAGAHGPIVVPSAVSKWAPAGTPTPLRSGACQVKIEWERGANDYRVTGVKLAFVWQNENVGALPFSGQGQVTPPEQRNPFTNTGYPVSSNLPSPPVPPPPPPPTPGYYDVGLDFMQGIVLSIDEQHVFIAYNDATNTYQRIAKVNLSDRTIEATQDFGDTIYSGAIAVELLASPDGLHIYTVLVEIATGDARIIGLSTTDLSIQNNIVNPTGHAIWDFDLSEDGTTLVCLADIIAGTNTCLVLVDTSAFTTTVVNTAVGYTHGLHQSFGIAWRDATHVEIVDMDQTAHVGFIHLDRVNTSTGAVTDFIVCTAPVDGNYTALIERKGDLTVFVVQSYVGVSAAVTVNTSGAGAQTGRIDMGIAGLADFVSSGGGSCIAITADTIGGAHAQAYVEDASSSVYNSGVPRIITFPLPPTDTVGHTMALAPTTDQFLGITVNASGSRIYSVDHDQTFLAILEGLY